MSRIVLEGGRAGMNRKAWTGGVGSGHPQSRVGGMAGSSTAVLVVGHLQCQAATDSLTVLGC